MPGGFIGVDIFFVISGFLISSHLLKTTLSGEHLSLVGFYAKRIRRLLPAAFLVLFVSILGMLAFLPIGQWGRNLTEIFWAAAYGENLYLTVQAVNYHALGQDATVAQHYWSLSVEEQFYFLWPLLLVGLAHLGHRLGYSRRAFTGIGIGLFSLIFLAFSVWFTHASPAQAYFFTPVRFWEFGIGALVALGVPLWSRHADNARVLAARLTAAVLGWGTLIASTFLFSPSIPFPSATALIPVAATALVIAAGTGVKLPVIDKVAGLRPIRWIGDVSYSIYLWHWPLIVLAPAALREDLNWKHKIVIALVTFVLAGVTKPQVEDRGIHSAWLGASNLRSFASMLTAVACFALLWVGLTQWQHQLVRQHEAQMQEFLASPCVGPKALDPANGCTNLLDAPVTTVLGEESNYYAMPPECTQEKTGHETEKFGGITVCDFRKDTSVPATPEETIMLVGDSHADQWKWPLKEIAQATDKRLEVLIVGGCVVRSLDTEEDFTLHTYLSGGDCAHTAAFISDYVKEKTPRTVVYSTYAKDEPLADHNHNRDDQQGLYNEALGQTWKSWRQSGVQNIRVIADTPYNDRVRDINCFTRSENPALECRTPRAEALGADPLPGAVDAVNDPQVQLVDFTDAFCDAEYCYAVAGQLPVYFDPTHVNRQYSLLLVPRLAEVIP